MTMPEQTGFKRVIWPTVFRMLVKPDIQKGLDMLKDKLEPIESGS